MSAADAELDQFTAEVSELVQRHMRGELERPLREAIAELREASRERLKQALKNIGN